MLLNIFSRIKQKKQLEEKILNLIYNAEECMNSNLKLGIQYLKQANKDYKKLSYNFKINCKINEVCFAYADKYL